VDPASQGPIAFVLALALYADRLHQPDARAASAAALSDPAMGLAWLLPALALQVIGRSQGVLAAEVVAMAVCAGGLTAMLWGAPLARRLGFCHVFLHFSVQLLGVLVHAQTQPMKGHRKFKRSLAIGTDTWVAGCCCSGCTFGTTIARSFAFGASTPWNRMRCSLGRGTSAASRCMNSSVLITRCVVPSRHGVLSLSCTCPAALSCTRASDSAEVDVQVGGRAEALDQRDGATVALVGPERRMTDRTRAACS
jgi:hypothetical protein